jgi:glycosyltransferase involved in cell wall biosynthesis
MTYGLDDYVLCVGRLEPRKNQLMLLASMEDSDRTLVFADGGFAYGDEYAAACRNFARKGRTVFTGRLSRSLLISAYRNARVACSPSWYELPGLATLEAARWSPRVVASPWGTVREYLGEGGLYAEPDDIRGLEAVLRDAWNRGPVSSLSEHVAAFTWIRTALETERVYREIAAGGD